MYQRAGISRRAAIAGALTTALAMTIQPFIAQSAYASGTLPPNNPPANIAASPDFFSSCPSTASAANTSATCTAAAVQAIDNARSQEGVGSLILPSNYISLTPAEQIYVVAYSERVDRGLSAPVGLVDTYDQESLTGANTNTDPVGPSGAAWGSNVATGVISVLGTDYAWMYLDGPGGNNIDCTATNTSGCWGHRDNILGGTSAYGSGTLYMGAAQGTPDNGAAYADIFVAPYGTQPTVYTYPTPAPTSTPTPVSQIGAGQELTAGQSMVSTDGTVKLVMQTDGNLVMYGPGGALWASRTQNTGSYAVLQYDGNFVVYGPSGAVWASGTQNNPNDVLIVQNDGNLVLYVPSGPIWATGTTKYYSLAGGQFLQPGQKLQSGVGAYTYIMQTDGNLVLYGPSGALWASNTQNRGTYAAMQTDGNFVVYGPSGAVWASGTQNHPGAILYLQNNGNVIISIGGTTLFATNT